MASKNEGKSKLMGFGGTVLYYIAILCLLILIGLMYNQWNGRKRQYEQLVKEASLQDHAYDIALKKNTEESDELIENSMDASDSTK